MYPSAINLLLLLYFTYISPITQMVKRKRRGHRQKTSKMPSYTISDEELDKVVHDFLDPTAGMVGLGVSIPSSTTSQHPALSQNKDVNEDAVTNSSLGFDDAVTDENKALDKGKLETDRDSFGEMGTDSPLSHTSTDTTNPSTKVTSTVQSTKDVQPPSNTSNQDLSKPPTIPFQPTAHSTHESALNARLTAYKDIYDARLAAHAATLDTQLVAHENALDARLTAHENNLNTTLATTLTTLQTNLRNDTRLALQLLEHSLLHNLHVIPTSHLDTLPRKNDIRNDYKDLVAHVNEALDRGTRLVQSAVVEILHEEMRMLRTGVAGKERMGEGVGLQELFGEVGAPVGRREERPLETVGAVPEEQADGPDFVVLGLFVLGFFLLWLWSPKS